MIAKAKKSITRGHRRSSVNARRERPLRLRVRALSRQATSGVLTCGNLILRCALGRGGLRTRKREGDGATPVGEWRLCEVRYRADRGLPPVTRLPRLLIRPSDGWCDAGCDRNYNRPVRLPYRASAEAMFRDDHLYDIVVVLDYNLSPRVRGRGSAIFMHLARSDYSPTAGCIALSRRDLRLLLSHIRRRAIVTVQA